MLRTPPIPIANRWERRPLLSPGSPAWRYLACARRLPGLVLLAASAAGVIREGAHSSAWFAHRDRLGRLTGIEMRGPAWRAFSAGGTKTLFRLPGGRGFPPRLAVCEAAIDARSLAAFESVRTDTLYTATAGGMGPASIEALRQHLCGMTADPAGLLIAATDADAAGRRHAARLATLATEAGVRFTAIVPPRGSTTGTTRCVRGHQGRDAASHPKARHGGKWSLMKGGTIRNGNPMMKAE